MTSTSDSLSGRAKYPAGFTLVELLVVIGIIALLIGILLPSLSAARESSKRAACAAKLHNIMVAATLHVTDHQGFYPLAGQISGNLGVNGITPDSVSDSYTSRYSWMGWTALSQYTSSNDIRILAPITFALGSEMGFKQNLTYQTDAQMNAAGTDTNGLIRNFLCPSQAASYDELHQLCFLYGGAQTSGLLVGWTDLSSYIYNEYVVGFDDSHFRLRGEASRVKQPANTMFASDGLGGSVQARQITAEFASLNDTQYPPPWPFLTIYNNNSKPYAPITLSDALTGASAPPSANIGSFRLAGDAANFDQRRHRGKMNIAFCDGHVELRDIPAFTMNSQGTAATLKYDPTAKGLKNVYIVPN